MTDVTGVSDDELVAGWGLITAALNRTQVRVLARIEATGVQAQWFAVLHLLLRADGHRLPMSKIAADLTMTSGGFTKLADRMARDGLIDRRNSAGDRRVIFAALTEQGLQTARHSEQLYLEGLREHVLDVLTPETLAELVRTFGVLDADPLADSPAPEDIPIDRDPMLPERRRRGGAGE